MIEIKILNNGSGFYVHWRNKEKLHRLDGPAVTYSGGTQEWYKDGKIHRDDDKPAGIYSNGIKVWFKEGAFVKQELE